MIIGIPKEIKNHEYRVGATPAFVKRLTSEGHQVIVEQNAGGKIGFKDELYQKAGARIVPSAEEVYQADLIIKVKEPLKVEFPFLREGQILFCYLHLAADLELTRVLMEKKVVAIAYETVTDAQGRLPLLTPMSEIAGRIAVQVGATSLQMNNGGKGLLLGGVAGVLPANVLIIGGGVVGTESARMAMGLGANVTLLDKDLNRLRLLDTLFGPRLKTVYSLSSNLEEALRSADLVIGAVLIPGKKAPKLISRAMLKEMEAGSVLVDVAIDQGGCAETSRATTHEEPTFMEEGILHYCVTNMPGACPKTSTIALTNATLEDAVLIANFGYEKAFLKNPGLREGLNVCYGRVTNRSVAEEFGFPSDF